MLLLAAIGIGGYMIFGGSDGPTDTTAAVFDDDQVADANDAKPPVKPGAIDAESTELVLQGPPADRADAPTTQSGGGVTSSGELARGQQKQSPMTFTVTSTETKDFHEYGTGYPQSTISVKAGYKLLLVGFTLSNTTSREQHFSSQHFHVLDKDGKKVNAILVGIANSIAESGATLSVNSKISSAKGKLIVTYKGKISTSASSIKWNLAQHQEYSTTLLFVIPDSVQNPRLEFQNAMTTAAKAPIPESHVKQPPKAGPEKPEQKRPDVKKFDDTPITDGPKYLDVKVNPEKYVGKKVTWLASLKYSNTGTNFLGMKMYEYVYTISNKRGDLNLHLAFCFFGKAPKFTPEASKATKSLRMVTGLISGVGEISGSFGSTGKVPRLTKVTIDVPTDELIGKLTDQRFVTALMAKLKDKNNRVRHRAAYELGGLGDKRALEPLIAALKDKEWTVRSTAAEALGYIGDKGAVAPLVAMLDDDYNICLAASEALKKIGEPSVAPLIASLQNKKWKSSTNKAKALRTLGVIGGKRAIKILLRASKDKDLFVYSAALEALGDIGDKSTVGELIPLLKEPAMHYSIVVEALTKITGQNFGENYDKWNEWHKKQ